MALSLICWTADRTSQQARNYPGTPGERGSIRFGWRSANPYNAMLSRVVGVAQSLNYTKTADAHYVGWS